LVTGLFLPGNTLAVVAKTESKVQSQFRKSRPQQAALLF
jgi:hypothetical protein